ncbi:MAG: aspartyl-tRNA(Asn)/glutamyl-tRNA(Gln) amidotransferase subunit C [Salibacteraceae bacterium]|jgi:aspartyl-tRNA(Asn)/glutamyl-tRNA(Gln) amidotransferase subunit C
MKIDNSIVDKVAGLSKLEYIGEEKEAIKKDMERILTFMDLLNEVDTEGVEPLKYVTEGIMNLRKDESHTKISKVEALENAPSKDSDYFKVPKVLNK